MNRIPRRPRSLTLVGTALIVGAQLVTASAAADTRPDATTRPLVVVVDSPTNEIQPQYGSGYSNGIWVSNVERADLTDVTVTVDASALKGVSDDVDVPCDADGDLIGVCHGIGPVRKGVPVRVGAVRVGRPKTSTVGTFHQVRITATAGDGSRGMQRYTVTVPETGPTFDRGTNAREQLTPGGTLPLPGGFTNFTRAPLPAVRVELTLSPGLSLTKRFRNCVWVSSETRSTTVSCKVLGPFEPLASYDLDLGAVRADVHAMRETIGYQVRSMPADARLVQIPLGNERTGDGPDELTAVPRSAAPTHIRTDGTVWQPLDTAVDVANTADFAVTGTTLRGRPGEVVRAEFTVRNLGPGSRNPTQKEELSNYGQLWLSVPPGVTVVHAPPTCYGYRTNRPSARYKDIVGLGKPKGRGYGCRGTIGQFLAVGNELRYAFEFRIEASRDLRPGSVTTMYREDDPHPENSTARIEVEVR
ncbi:hypothetical protein [Streptomyces rhizosphaerihabitans]|uniref:hypothetical protein n=1 Tax=Streptomyces rhizosphaerihabitans TaxID=1266770 RepID=UPI0021C09773|nr:hypothetical protein [Streptomyces rhizosphaerihabitans]MCT9010693.1 hypothetical protein [Streptomyces rhizosphaerihabitans]